MIDFTASNSLQVMWEGQRGESFLVNPGYKHGNKRPLKENINLFQKVIVL
jgi:hypothetical protein